MSTTPDRLERAVPSRDADATRRLASGLATIRTSASWRRPPDMAEANGRRHALLALDTATNKAVVALGAPDGTRLAETWWLPGFRHGETLLPTIRRVVSENNFRLSRIVAVIVGTGPGAVTGLRVG